MIKFTVKPVSTDLEKDLQKKVDNLTKPQGSLGILEEMAIKIGKIQNTLTPTLNNPTLLVFAGDHGITEEGVSPFPKEVTYQMVMNFVAGGAGINVFSRQNGIDIKVVDAGVDYDFPKELPIERMKVGKGTRNFYKEPAMSEEDLKQCLQNGADLVYKVHESGCNVIGFGEMGIGNTSPASIIMSKLCNIPVKDCIGKGAGLDNPGVQRKIEVLQAAVEKYPAVKEIGEVLSTFGGYEINMTCGAMLKAAELGMVLLIDGFIATSALLAASKINPHILDYCIFCHKSNESAHKRMLEELKANAILDLGFRLGEGTGVSVAYPIVKSAVAMINEMASFESANVTASTH